MHDTQLVDAKCYAPCAMRLNDLKKKKLPDSPGVYLFKKRREILYIGKATSLRDRVRSYFSNDLIKTRGPAIVDMVIQSSNIDFQKTDSVLEALILESNLIKKHQPKYNVKEKDNKSYNHVVITDETYPRVLLVRSHELKNNKLNFKIKKEFGPFPNSGQLSEALKLVQKIFPFFNTNKPVDKLNPSDQKRVGLNIQIGIYPDVFSGKVSKTDYKKNIRNLTLFFEGKKGKVLTDLKKQMKELSKKQEFEKANEIKKTIFALEHINDVSLLGKPESLDSFDFVQDKFARGKEGFRIEAYDIAHTAGKQTVGVMVVFEDGELKKSDYRKFIIKDAKSGDDYGATLEVLERRLSHPEWSMPNLIVIDGGKGQRNVAVKLLEKYGNRIPVIGVVKDDKHKPKDFLGPKKYIDQYSKQILKTNNEAHRFAISFHRRKRSGLMK